MDKAMILDTLRSIIADTADLAPEQITSDCALMEDLDLSSMEIMTIVAELEDQFSLRIPEKELRNFVTISDLVDYLAERVH